MILLPSVGYYISVDALTIAYFNRGKKVPLASVCLSVRPSVHIRKLGKIGEEGLEWSGAVTEEARMGWSQLLGRRLR